MNHCSLNNKTCNRIQLWVSILWIIQTKKLYSPLSVIVSYVMIRRLWQKWKNTHVA